MIKEKKCPSCQITRPIELFSIRNKIMGYRNSYCNICINIRAKKWNQGHRERAIEHGRKYSRSHREQRKESSRRYRLANSAKVKARVRLYYLRNREHILEQHKQHNIQINLIDKP